MKKTLLRSFLLLCLGSLFFVACQQNEELSEITQESPNDLTLEEAKAWFESTYVAPTRTSADGLEKIPWWTIASAKQYKFVDGRSVWAIPIKYAENKWSGALLGKENDSKRPTKSDNKLDYAMLEQLLIFQEKGQSKAILMQMIPDKGYFSKNKTVCIKGDNFSGLAILREWGGRAIGGYQYKEGKVVDTFSVDKQASTPNGRTAGCWYQTVDHYTTTQSNGTTVITYDGSEVVSFYCSPSTPIATSWFGGGGTPSGGGGAGGAGAPNPPIVLEKLEILENKLNTNKFGLIDKCDIEFWRPLAQHTVPQPVKDKLYNKNNFWDTGMTPYSKYKVLELIDAQGTVVNMDYFPVKMTKLPAGFSTPESFLKYLRLHINDFVDTNKSFFEPYDTSEVPIWTSNNALGALIHIVIPFDDGSVVVSKHESTNWIFTTIQTPGDHQHPVSGNRQIGFISNSDGSFTFYTKAVDRVTGTLDEWINDVFGGPTFSGADELWTSMQNKIANYINSHGGTATVQPSQAYRPNWDKVKKYLTGQSNIKPGCN